MVNSYFLGENGGLLRRHVWARYPLMDGISKMPYIFRNTFCEKPTPRQRNHPTTTIGSILHSFDDKSSGGNNEI